MRTRGEVVALLEEFLNDYANNGHWNRDNWDNTEAQYCNCGGAARYLLRWLDKRGIGAYAILGWVKKRSVSTKAAREWRHRSLKYIDHCVVVLDGWAMDPTCAQFGQTRKVYHVQNFYRSWRDITEDWDQNDAWGQLQSESRVA